MFILGSPQIFAMSPYPWALPIIKHEININMNLTYRDHEVSKVEEGSYTYSLGVGRDLTPISRSIITPL
jgi:hypothetical protein